MFDFDSVLLVLPIFSSTFPSSTVLFVSRSYPDRAMVYTSFQVSMALVEVDLKDNVVIL